MTKPIYNIKPSTAESMAKFFMKTPVPRLIKKQKEEST